MPTLADMEGQVLAHIANRDAVGRRQLRGAIFNACREVIQQARDLGSNRLDATVAIDLETDKTMYPLPAFVGTLHLVERLDQSENARPLTRIPAIERHNTTQRGLNGYVPVGETIILTLRPAADYTAGLRLYYTPRIQESADDNWTPPFPEDLHEVVVAKALKRIRSIGGIAISPQDADRWIAECERRLTNWFYPDARDKQRGLRPGMPFYGHSRA